MNYKFVRILCILAIHSFAFVHAQSPSSDGASTPAPVSNSEPLAAGGLLNFLKENNVTNFHQEPIECPTIHLLHSEIFLSSDSCRDLNVDVPVPQVKGKLKVQGTFCYKASNDWKVHIRCQLAIFGYNLIHDNYEFYPGNSEVSQGFDAKVVAAKVTIGVYGNCLKIKGSGSYNIWFKKDSGTFDQNIHCF